MLLLQACGGGGLAGGDDNDIDPIYPEAGVEDESARPRPPEDAVVITTDKHFIYDAANQPVLLRGINHLYAADPVSRINGITAIKDVGSNVVRLQLDETTTEVQFEGAMAKVVENGLIAVVTLTAEGNKLTCTDEQAYLLKAVDDLWLKKFMPVLVQDRFQSHLMLNIADGWGPMNIFNEDSLGYREYIDTYKALIRKFRNAGFKFPLVIDAPSCGQDFNAFLKQRARELMAADKEKNLVFGVHVDGNRWNTSEKIVNAATQLYNEKVPFIVTGFTGSGVAGVEETPIDHADLIVKSAGDIALAFDLPWASIDDSAAYVMTLDESLNLVGGAVVAINVFLDKIYAEFELNESGNFVQRGKLSFALYLTDADGNKMRAGSTSALDLRSNQWSKLSYDLPRSASDIDPAQLMGGSTTFDLSSVVQIGIETFANGKAVALNAPIKFDELIVLPGVISHYAAGFDTSNDGWARASGDVDVGLADGALTLKPTGEALAIQLADNEFDISTIPFDKTLEVTHRIYLPAEYAGKGLWSKLFGQFGEQWEGWAEAGFNVSSLVPGEWTEVRTIIAFHESISPDHINVPRTFGLQVGGFSGDEVEPILIDMIGVSDVRPTKTVTALQYRATFTSGTEGFVNAGWDGGQAAVSMIDGELLVTVPDGDGGAINKADINSISDINFEGGITVKMSIFIPADWAGDDFWVKFFMQDGSNWNHFEYTPGLTVDSFTPGEWTELEFVVTEFPANFSRTLKPNMFGMQYGNVPAGTIRIDNIEIYGDTQVDDTQPVLTIDFSTQEQRDAFIFDFAGGAFSEGVLATAKYTDWRVVPFGWTANSWKGHTGNAAALDISLDEDMVNLTERGEEVVNGSAGITDTSVPANF
jgi:hypothetical protein